MHEFLAFVGYVLVYSLIMTLVLGSVVSALIWFQKKKA